MASFNSPIDMRLSCNKKAIPHVDDSVMNENLSFFLFVCYLVLSE